jgi:C4-dicarboxylate-specific signal transduction histidine kinase
MKDTRKAKRPPVDELDRLRQRVSELETARVKQDEMERELRRLSRNLSERIKEMNCLYGISKLRDRNNISTEDVLRGIVHLIPSAWQYPEITCARLILAQREYRTESFRETPWRLACDIKIGNVPAGLLEVFYTEEKPDMDEGPFLKEERNLLEAVAERVRRLLEHEQAQNQARERKEQMIQMDKMAALGTMVSGVAHEINNPNNFIMLNAPVLWDAYRDILPVLEEYDKAHGDFTMGGLPYSEMRDSVPILFSGILEGAKRIKAIVDSLKDFARVDTSDIRQPVDINAVVRSAINLLSSHIKKSTKRLETRYAESLPPIQGNPQRLEQVIINLVQNACDALPDNSKGIYVSTRYDEGARSIVVEVRDEGVGINPDRLPHIMEPFNTTKRHKGGVGLGLSVSSGIVKDHDGSLSFTSIPEKGTTATMTLPATGATEGKDEQVR